MLNKKIELQKEIEKKRHAEMVRTKEKMKFMNKGKLLQEAFKQEKEWVRLQYDDIAQTVHSQEGLITRFADLVYRQEAQNIQLRTELLMNDHPRWQLIPTFEFITITDFNLLVNFLQKRLNAQSLFELRHKESDQQLLELFY